MPVLTHVSTKERRKEEREGSQSLTLHGRQRWCCCPGGCGDSSGGGGGVEGGGGEVGSGGGDVGGRGEGGREVWCVC
jgi:hypothetical protein